MAATPLTYGRFQAPEAHNGTLDVYEAGSLQNRKTTYSLPALTGANANPVVLDANGEADIFYSGTARLVLKNSSGTQIWDKDNIGLSGDTSSQWVNSLSATYASTTTFTLASDQTTEYHVGRRVRLTGSSTIYATISASSYSAPNTTVTITHASGFIDATLASAATGLNSASNESISIECISSAAVTGYVSGIRTYLIQSGVDTSGFNVAIDVVEDTFEAVGPTGSSAANIWTAMDIVPAAARIAILNVASTCITSGTDRSASVIAYARMTGSSEALNSGQAISNCTFPNDDYVTTGGSARNMVFVPLDTSRRFDVTWAESNTASRSVTLFLMGFIV
jgi:hypothetical protein